MSAATAAAPRYLCTVCDVLWSYRSVQHIACCPACGGGLVRDQPVTQPPTRQSRSLPAP